MATKLFRFKLEIYSDAPILEDGTVVGIGDDPVNIGPIFAEYEAYDDATGRKIPLANGKRVRRFKVNKTAGKSLRAYWQENIKIARDIETAVVTVDKRIETPGGAVNGTNTEFTTSSSYVSGSVNFFVNGVSTDANLTENGTNSITITPAPSEEDTVLVSFEPA